MSLLRLTIALYALTKRMGIRGRGLLLRQTGLLFRALQRAPLTFPGAPKAVIDFREPAVLALVDYHLGDLGHCRWLVSEMEKYAKPATALWDIGANTGVVSVHFANPEFGLAQVHAFEPNPTLATTLQGIFTDSSTVRVHSFGVGDTNGQFTLHVNPRESSKSSIVRQGSGSCSQRIQVRTLDRWFEEEGGLPPSVIKIDVEGFEPQVFAGMRQIIDSYRPAIFFEHIFMSDEEIDSLKPKDYTLRYISDSGKVSENASERVHGHDAYFIPLS